MSGLAAAVCIAIAAVAAMARVSFAQPSPAAPAPSIAQPAPSPLPMQNGIQPALMVEVVGLRDDHGRVGCSLFNDAKAFPRDDSKMFRHVWAPIRKDRALCEYHDVPAGRYALVVFHDENGDGEFNQNAFGMPLEGYGFSNDAAALFDAPKFDAAAFNYDGKRLFLVIDIRY